VKISIKRGMQVCWEEGRKYVLNVVIMVRYSRVLIKVIFMVLNSFDGVKI